MGRRYKVKGRPRHYVHRDRLGRFKKWTQVGKGIRVDKRRKVDQRTKKVGYGHLQDYY